MNFNVMLTGVGGEGALITSVVLARAASIEGHYVRGVQFHGLAQRGGSIPTYVRFSSQEVASPFIPRGEADLVISLEPAEAPRVCYYASKGRTSFLIDNYPIIPVYSYLLGEKYPDNRKIERMIAPFSRRTIIADASSICERELGDQIYGNVMILGIALKQGLLPLKKASIIKAIKATVPRGVEKDIEALSMGMDYKA